MINFAPDFLIDDQSLTTINKEEKKK